MCALPIFPDYVFLCNQVSSQVAHALTNALANHNSQGHEDNNQVNGSNSSNGFWQADGVELQNLGE